jgi:hypothetical protein
VGSKVLPLTGSTLQSTLLLNRPEEYFFYGFVERFCYRMRLLK